MESRENLRRYWPVAFTASAVLHGAIVAAFAFLCGGQAGEPPLPAHFVSLSLVEEYATGDITLEEPSAPRAGKTPFHDSSKPPAPDTEPLVAKLVDPWSTTSIEVTSVETSNPNAKSGDGGAGASGGAGLTNRAATSFFSIEARGRLILYVVDASASMGKNGALAFACRELKASIHKLPPEARFQIILYAKSPRTLPAGSIGWLEPTATVLQEVSDALDRLAQQTPEGGTDHAPALRQAFLARPDVVYFLTDADDLTPEHLRLARERNEGRAVVNTIELTTRHRGQKDMALQVLAREHRGNYQAVELQR